ncbi:MAG: methyl-accepting chemotaxis protein [Pseudomonas sp.]
MEELSATVKQNADNAHHASKLASEASGTATLGGKQVGEVVDTMQQISGSSKRIAEITSVINGIAFQTNILALNAAVEAARAGEQGRGFAVVASEVRSLAQRSAQAAKEIKVLIESTVSSVASGSAQVRLASDSMSEIVSNVSNVSSVMLEITHASEEQMLSIHEINRAITQLDGMVQQNAAMVQQSTGAASALQEQATGLAVAVGHFRV